MIVIELDGAVCHRSNSSNSNPTLRLATSDEQPTRRGEKGGIKVQRKATQASTPHHSGNSLSNSATPVSHLSSNSNPTLMSDRGNCRLATSDEQPTRHGKKGGITVQRKATQAITPHHSSNSSSISATPVAVCHPSNSTNSNSTLMSDRGNFCRLGLINARSVCNKTELVVEHLLENCLDVMCVTETWLSDTEKHTKVIGDLTPAGFSLFHLPRLHRIGVVLLSCIVKV